MKDLTWKHVIVIVAFFGTVAALTMTGHDTGAFVAIGLGVLAGLGLVAVKAAETTTRAAAVETQTNGNTTRMLEMIAEQAAMLARMHPPSGIVVDTQTEGNEGTTWTRMEEGS